jgi:hypothetical protein
MNIELVEWQAHDAGNGLVMPWWTHPFLVVMKNWDLSDKYMLELGAGLGTAWLRDKCKWVDSVDASPEWAERAEQYCQYHDKLNGQISCELIADGVEGGWEQYKKLIPENVKYDVISIDGIYRVECIEWALEHFKGRGGVMIIDNLDQDFVFISPKAMELIEGLEGEVFIQPNHTNHSGKAWNTRYYNIKNEF